MRLIKLIKRNKNNVGFPLGCVLPRRPVLLPRSPPPLSILPHPSLARHAVWARHALRVGSTELAKVRHLSSYPLPSPSPPSGDAVLSGRRGGGLRSDSDTVRKYTVWG